MLVDSKVWGFTLGAAVVTGLGCGLVAAWGIWRSDLQATLKEGGQRSSAPFPHAKPPGSIHLRRFDTNEAAA